MWYWIYDCDILSFSIHRNYQLSHPHMLVLLQGVINENRQLEQSLKAYNTFAVDSYTSNITEIHQKTDIHKLRSQDYFDPDDCLIIGAGSNLLLLDKVPSNVIVIRTHGIHYQSKSKDHVIVTVAAGVSWHHLVKNSLAHGLMGLENLALIPGLVGAAPIQNIGAYGVELCDLFVSLSAINLNTGEERLFCKEDCQFNYRDSFFKHGDGKNYLIHSVSLRLSKSTPVNISYRALSDAFSDVNSVTAEQVFDKVCQIRASKLPDPKVLSNAGSFFKNPVVDFKKYQRLKGQFPNIVAYPQSDGCWKLAAGWMIEKVGLKGYRMGMVGVHADQALVLVNYGDASGKNVAELARFVCQKVEALFSIYLEVEVTIVGASGVLGLERA